MFAAETTSLASAISDFIRFTDKRIFNSRLNSGLTPWLLFCLQIFSGVGVQAIRTNIIDNTTALTDNGGIEYLACM